MSETYNNTVIRGCYAAYLSPSHVPQVPIEFEFQIRELRSNPSFRIDPSRGVVPAHGSITVEITFAPTMLRTEEMVIEVRICSSSYTTLWSVSQP